MEKLKHFVKVKINTPLRVSTDYRLSTVKISFVLAQKQRKVHSEIFASLATGVKTDRISALTSTLKEVLLVRRS